MCLQLQLLWEEILAEGEPLPSRTLQEASFRVTTRFQRQWGGNGSVLQVSSLWISKSQPLARLSLSHVPYEVERAPEQRLHSVSKKQVLGTKDYTVYISSSVRWCFEG